MIDVLSAQGASQWARWVWDTGWQGGLIGVVAFLAAVLVGRRRPALAYGIVVVALLKFLIPPLIPAPAVLGVSELTARAAIGETHEEQAARLDTEPKKARSTSTSPADDPFGSMPSGAERNSHPANAAAIDEADVHGESERAADAETLSNSPRWWWSSVAFRCYLLGVVVVSSWIVIGWLRVARLVATAAPPDASLDRLWQRTLQQLMPRRTIRLLVSDQRISPLAFGVLGPVVLVPSELIETLNEHQRRTVLAHEIMHHRRHDPWVIALELCVMALWWFHPVAWVLLYTSRGLRERCCDEATVKVLGEPAVQYAGVLESVARWLAGRRMSFPRTSATMHPIGVRIHHLLDPLRETRPMKPRTVLWLLGAWSVFCLPTVRMSDAQSAPPAEATAAEEETQAPVAEQRRVFGSAAFTVTTAQAAGILVLNEGRHIAAATASDCVILNSKTGAVEHVLSPPAWKEKRHVLGVDVTRDGRQLVVARAEPRDIPSVDHVEFLIFDAQTFEQIRAVSIDVPRTVRDRPTPFQTRFRIGSDVGDAFLLSENILLKFDITGPGRVHTYPKAVVAFDLAPNGSRLATLGLDRAVTVWNIGNDTPVGEFPLGTRWQNAHGGGIFFTPDEKELIVIDFMGADPTVWLASESGQVLRRQPASGRASAATISDGRLWRALELFKEDHPYRISAMDLADGSVSHEFSIPDRAATIAYDPANDRLIGTAGRRVRIWNPSSGELQNPLPSNATDSSWNIGLIANGSYLLSNGSMGGFIDVWDVGSGQHVPPTKGPTGELAAVSPQGDYYLTASLFSGYTVRSAARPDWHVSVGRATRFDSLPPSPPVGFSEDGKQVRILEPDGALTVWDAASGEPSSRLDLTQKLGEPFPLRDRIKVLGPYSGAGVSAEGKIDYRGAGDISRWGRWLVYSDTEWVRGYPLESDAGDAWEISLNWSWPTVYGRRWDVSNDGRRFIYQYAPDKRSPGEPFTATIAMKSIPAGDTLWQRATTRQSHLSISPNGKWVAYQGEGTADAIEILVIADVESGGELARQAMTSGITTLAWSPDSRLLSTAHYDTTVIVWPISDLLRP